MLCTYYHKTPVPATGGLADGPEMDPREPHQIQKRDIRTSSIRATKALAYMRVSRVNKFFQHFFFFLRFKRGLARAQFCIDGARQALCLAALSCHPPEPARVAPEGARG